MATPVKFAAEVTEVVRHAPDVATFHFRYLDRRPRYKPGQFVHLALEPYDAARHWPESRAFTIAAGATNQELLRLTIAVKGSFTRRIFDELQVGRRVALKGPYGEFVVRCDAEREIVLIAGGTGVTPFVAFMEDALAGGLGGEVRLHYGARSPDLLVFRSVADRCAAALPRFRVQYYAETGATEPVACGRINLERVRQSLRDANAAIYYLCGPQSMVDRFHARLLGEFGVAPLNVKLDQWE
jgi:ferredoxin-NADP reductase